MRIPVSTNESPWLQRRISRRSFIAGGILGLASLATGCGVRDDSSNIQAAPNLDLGYPAGNLLVDAGWLTRRIDDPSLRLLDCSPLPAYRAGHLPVARHVWWQDTIELHNPVYGMLVNPDGRAELTRQAGIQHDSQVVCYDNAGGVYAARVLWMLRYMGFRSGGLLIGGREGWRAAGHDLTRAEPESSVGGIDDIFDESIVAQPQDILSRLDEPGLTILDTRTEEERHETWNNKLRSGMIPGSVWLPRDQFLQNQAVPQWASELVSRLAPTFSLDTTAEVIVYGLHGTLASLPYHLLMALGRFHVRLYDGSWAQWGADESLPADPLS
ncbi:3-mercaptopyruvate sulfurtransferase [soil metagenome]